MSTRYIREILRIIREHGVEVVQQRQNRHWVIHCRHGHRDFTLTLSVSPGDGQHWQHNLTRDIRRSIRA